jgi:hypothetical protein
LVIMTVDELEALSPLERQMARRAARAQPLLRRILRAFLERGGPIPVAEVAAASDESAAEAVCRALFALDDDDLIRIRDGHIDIAYPRRRRSSFACRAAASSTPAARWTRSGSPP